MKHHTPAAGILAGGLFWVLPFCVVASEGTEKTIMTDQRPEVRVKVEAASQYPLPYVPPHRGVVSARLRIGGGTRTGSAGPKIVLLAPEGVGLTRSAQPAFYWYADGTITEPVTFSVIDRSAVLPLVTVTLPGPILHGVHAIRLVDYQVRLMEETIYDWSIAVIRDPQHRSRDIVAEGSVQVAPRYQEAQTGEPDTILWYDGVTAMYDVMAAVTENASLESRHFKEDAHAIADKIHTAKEMDKINMGR